MTFFAEAANLLTASKDRAPFTAGSFLNDQNSANERPGA